MSWPQLCRNPHEQSGMSRSSWWHVEEMRWKSLISFFFFWGGRGGLGAAEQHKEIDKEKKKGKGIHVILVAHCSTKASTSVHKWQSRNVNVFRRIDCIQNVRMVSKFFKLAHWTHFQLQFGLDACSDWGHIERQINDMIRIRFRTWHKFGQKGTVSMWFRWFTLPLTNQMTPETISSGSYRGEEWMIIRLGLTETAVWM